MVSFHSSFSFSPSVHWSFLHLSHQFMNFTVRVLISLVKPFFFLLVGCLFLREVLLRFVLLILVFMLLVSLICQVKQKEMGSGFLILFFWVSLTHFSHLSKQHFCCRLSNIFLHVYVYLFSSFYLSSSLYPFYPSSFSFYHRFNFFPSPLPFMLLWFIQEYIRVP